MRLSTGLLAALPLTAHAARLVLTNDDGWAEKNIRTLYDALTAAGENVVLSAPAENKSGSGSNSQTPAPRTQPCQFNSCPANSPAIGSDPSNPRFNYVNAFPVDAARNGINVAPSVLGGRADLVVSGINADATNLGLATLFSGTVGAATDSSTQGFAAIAFSGASGPARAFTEPTPIYSSVYADLAVNVTQTLLRSGPAPLLPRLTFLNVNFPEVTATRCNSAAQFRFALSRINSAIFAGPDVETCGSTRLPTEFDVVRRAGCWASISVGGNNKRDTSAENQAAVLRRLAPILSCP